jgi:glutathione S-transferase
MALELGLDYESIPVIQARRLSDPLAPGVQINTHAAEFLTINPNGHIPTIDDDGLVLWESLAINHYLARKHGGPLAPQNSTEDGLMMMWSLWAATEIEPHSVKIVLTYDNELQATTGGRSTIEVATRILKKPFEILNAHLATKDYLVNNRFSVADLNAAEVIRYAMSEKALTEQNPNVVAWYERCHDRNAFRKMMELRRAEG